MSSNANDQLLKRSEVPSEHKWVLEDMFPSLEAWENEYAQVKKQLDSIRSFAGKLNEASSIKSCFALEDDISLHMERLYVYANMKHHEDMTAPQYQALSDKAKKLSIEVSEALSFITPEILSLSEDELKELIANPELNAYKRTLEEMLRQKPHVLSGEQEALLAQAGTLAQAPGTIFGMINNADLKFPKIKNAQGEEVELTHGRYIQFLESRDRDVRKAAFKAMYDTYAKQKNTLAATLNANVNKNVFYSKVRNYPSVLEMSLFGDNIPKEVYTNLIDTIHEHLPLLQRYFKLRKQLLQVDELHMYDLFTPLVNEIDMEISYEEAKNKVKESLAPLGESYVSILEDGFNNGWIDVYENEGNVAEPIAGGHMGHIHMCY